jgi:hypothetical protein
MDKIVLFIIINPNIESHKWRIQHPSLPRHQNSKIFIPFRFRFLIFFPVALPVSKDCFAVGDNCPMLHKNIIKINFSTGWGVSGLGLAQKNHFLSIFRVNLEHFSSFFYFFGITIKNATKWLLQFF